MPSPDTHRPPVSATQADATQIAYAVASALLAYPGSELLGALPAMHSVLPAHHQSILAPLFSYLQEGDLIDLQENYVDTFDGRRAYSLHLFEHILGDSRDRGQAMIDLRDEYLRHGLEPDPHELPDYVPLFLEFLAQIPAADAAVLLGEAIHVLARLGDRLSESGSPYAVVFGLLRSFTQVVPEPLPDLPDEAPEEEPVTFGPDGRGVNPARALESAGEQPVTFYARDGCPMNTAADHRGAQPGIAVPNSVNRH